jgi:hypothetical protein
MGFSRSNVPLVERLEFFADDEKQKCPKCGLVLTNPRQQVAD